MEVKVSASYSVRTAIEKILYDLAYLHAIDAETARQGNKANDELEHTIQSIILSAACMEAFINQEGIKALKQEFYRYDKGQIDIWGNDLNRGDKEYSYPSLESKWCEITERISGKQFDKGKYPFQGFHELVNLRNEILHYKAMSGPPVHVPSRGNITPERAKFTSKAAQDAVKSMKGMLEEYHTLTGKKLPVWIK